jgi:hypothetical protein
LRLVLINECLDNNNWAEDSRERLKAVEVACWYVGPEGDLDQEAEDTPPKKKRRKSRRRSGQSDTASQKDVVEYAKSHPTPPTPKISGESHDDQWRSSVDDTLKKLMTMMQASSQVQPEAASSSAPPIPPRPTNMGKSQSDSDQTIPKQRPLPSNPIPKKKTAGKEGQSSFEFSRTMQEEEGFDDTSETEDVYSDDELLFDSSDVQESDLGRLEKRKMHLKGIPFVVPDLKVPMPVKKKGRFELLQEKVKDNQMPFLAEMYDEINRVSIVKERAQRQRDPFSLLAKFYPTDEPAESGILINRPVPRELLNHVPAKSQVKSGISGRQAQLKPSSADGTKEAAARHSFKQAAGYMRLANNLEIDVEMSQTLVDNISTLSKDIQAMKGLPKEAKSKLLQMGQKIRVLNSTVYDIRSTNADLVRCSLYQYQRSLVDRRDAWIKAAKVLEGTANELRLADFPTVSHRDPSEQINMFGPEGTNILKENDAIQQQASLHNRHYQGPAHTWVPSMGGPPQNQRFRQNYRGSVGYGPGTGYFNPGQGRGFFPQGQPLGRGQDNYRRRPSGGRRPNNRGGRGRQPFNQAPASNRKN